jgi:hypothetical protein
MKVRCKSAWLLHFAAALSIRLVLAAWQINIVNRVPRLARGWAWVTAGGYIHWSAHRLANTYTAYVDYGLCG